MSLRARGLPLFLVFILWTPFASAVLTEVIHLRFYVSSDSPTDEAQNAHLKQMVGRMQACLNEAVQAGGADWQFDLRMDPVKTRPREMVLPQEKGAYPLLNGKYFSTDGSRAKRFSFYFYDTQLVERGNTFSAMGYAVRHPLDEQDYAALERHSILASLIEEQYQNDAMSMMNPYGDENSGSPLQDMVKEYEALSSHLTTHITHSAELYINDQYYKEYNTHLPEILSHEFLHGWGGLKDLYVQDDLENVDNLMHNRFVCRLTPAQIKAMGYYRTEHVIEKNIPWWWGIF